MKTRKTNKWLENWFDWKLRNIAHQLRHGLLKNKETYHWQIAVSGKGHISEMNRNELLIYIANLISKEMTGHSIGTHQKQRKYKRVSFKIPFTKYIFGIFIKKLKG